VAASLARAQFIFTDARGRPAIFWQTRVTAKAANPGARVPRGRTKSAVPSAMVVVEGRYSSLLKLKHVSGTRLADMLSRLQIRYPEVQMVFADSRRFAEDWMYRFLTAALSEVPVDVEPP
jgi:hypothetical protein